MMRKSDASEAQSDPSEGCRLKDVYYKVIVNTTSVAGPLTIQDSFPSPCTLKVNEVKTEPSLY